MNPRKLYRRFKSEVLVLPGRTLMLSVCVFLLLMPLVYRPTYTLRVLSLTFIFAIFAASWDLLSGFVGQLSLGHAIFFGVAAYTSALLNLHTGLTPLVTIPLGALVSVLMGLIVGIPCLRLKGQYLSLATMAFPIILTGVVYLFSGVTGGELGVSGLSRLGPTRLSEYYITLVLVLALGFIMWKITDSKLGLIFHAIREDEITARASGINTPMYKLLAFCLSGFFAGISGGLYSHFMRIAGPSTLSVFTSFQPVIWTIFGGMASIYGAVAGTFVLYPAMEFLRIAPQVRSLIFAVLVILALRFMPEGLTPWFIDRVESECPRCKEHNAITRKTCRVCGAPLGRPAAPASRAGSLQPGKGGRAAG